MLGAVSSTDAGLEAVEPSFQQDLNGDGVVGVVPTRVIETSGTTKLWLVGNEYVMQNSGGADITIKYLNAAVTAGQFGIFAPIGAEQTGSGYEVAWKTTNGSNLYVIWNTDSSGNYISTVLGAVSSVNFSLEDLEPSFQQDLNGDGQLSAQLITAGPTVDLTGQTQAVTINLGTNTASASAGLSQPSLTFIKTPDSITLGTGASIVEYALQPSSGIETISKFVLGTDELNIDLAGAANSTLLAFDTNGNTAIALASSADPLHGIVLLNLSPSMNAANLLSSHTTFVGGHALIG